MKSIKKLAEFIEKSNVLFEAMTKDEKKVQIAKDCIERINLNQFIANTGNFISDRTMDELRRKRVSSKSVKELINNSDFPECQVCAKGGLFLSYVGRVNQCNIIDIAVGNSIEDNSHKKLLEIFTERELAYIEFAFEGGQYISIDLNGDYIHFTETESKRVFNFYQRYDDVDKRLIAICQNIIRNKGIFKLSKHYDKKIVQKSL